MKAPGGGGERLLLSMPAFDAKGAGVVKRASVYPDNAAKGWPNIQAAIVALSETGRPVALLEGTVVTHLSTGAASALAKREADDDAVRRSRIFVDTFAGALSEAGDLLDPLARGVIERGRIEGELADLVCGRIAGRGKPDEIILFKSMGPALEDLVATQLILAAAAVIRQ